MRVCKKCGIQKEYVGFNVSKRHRDGYNSNCIPCRKEYIDNWYFDNKEKLRE